MSDFRKLTKQEIVQLINYGNRADDWHNVVVSDDFSATQLNGCRLCGNVKIGSNTTIEDSTITNYEIGKDTVISRVTAIECRQRSSFGNGTRINAINENGGRSVVIFDKMSAQYAYMMAMYRHRPVLISNLEAIATKYAESKSDEVGHIGDNCRIIGAKFIRETFIGDNVSIDGTSILENGTILNGAKIGVDVKAKAFIIAENSTVDFGAICHNCFIGESVTISNGFTADNSLFFANSHCENGEATSIFAGPYTVSHHKSTLLIAGFFSFFNAGSGTNQSNHLFKSGPVHQAIHRRGCKFASNAYVMSPAAEGAYTMIMGRHTKHHDTSDMPFSYLVENNGVSLLMPAMNLRSYGTLRDIHKWEDRDCRIIKRDVIDFNEYNPYITSCVIKALATLKGMYDKNPDAETYHYHNTTIKNSMLRIGIKLYEKYIVCAIGDMLFRGGESCSENCGDWIDLAGQYISRSAIDNIIERIEGSEITKPEQLDEYLHDFDKHYDDYAHSWAFKALGNRIGHNPTIEDVSAAINDSLTAKASMREVTNADLEKENSKDMSVGYGTDCLTEQERMNDFRAVRGLI